MTPSLSQVIMGAVTVAVTFLGVVLAQRGKRGDQLIQQNKDQFDRLLREAEWWKANATEARTELESFRDRQLARCRMVTDSAAKSIAKLIRYVPPDKQAEGARTLEEIISHNQTDHSDQAGSVGSEKNYPAKD